MVTNTAPDLLPVGNRTITVNRSFSTPLFAIDPDAGDTLTFSLESGPRWHDCRSSHRQAELDTRPDRATFTVTAVYPTVRMHLTAKVFEIEVVQAPTSGPTNNHPVLDAVANQSVEEGSLLTLVASATDPDPGDTLTYSLPRAPVGMTIDPGSGEIRFTPTPSQVGQHDVTLKVVDNGGLAGTTAFIVTVTSIAGAPVANDDLYTADMGETLTVSGPGVLENDSDPNGDLLTAILVQTARRGTLDLRPDGSFDYTAIRPQITANFKDVNMVFWLRPSYWASDYLNENYNPRNIVDGNLETSWLTQMRWFDIYGGFFTYQLNFDGEIKPTVKEVRIYGNRGAIADGHDIFSGTFKLYRTDGSIHESGLIDLEAPDRDAVYTPSSPITDVNRVEFVFSEFENKDSASASPGFSEIEVIAEQEVLDVTEEWKYTLENPHTSFTQVGASPAVGDINADGIPDIIFGCGQGMVDTITSFIKAISGADGSEIFIADLAVDGDVYSDQRINAAAHIAIGDIDGDDTPEILAFNVANFYRSRWIKAFKYDVATDTVSMIWTSDQIPETTCDVINYHDCLPFLPYGGTGTFGGPSIADLYGDGSPEIIAGIGERGVTVFDNTGHKLWNTLEDINMPSAGGHRYGASPLCR